MRVRKQVPREGELDGDGRRASVRRGVQKSPCDDVLRVAIHEAGHAKAGIFQGLPVDRVHLHQQGARVDGVTEIARAPRLHDAEDVKKFIVFSFAGMEATRAMCEGDCADEEEADCEQIAELAKHVPGVALKRLRVIARRLVRRPASQQWIRTKAAELVRKLDATEQTS